MLKKLINPFWASVALLAIIAVKAALTAYGFEHTTLLYSLMPLPLGVLAYTGGPILVVAASAATVLGEMLVSATFTGGVAPHAGGAAYATGVADVFSPVAKFLCMISSGLVVWLIASHLRKAFKQECGRSEDYLRKLYLARKENDTAMHDAQSHVRRCMEDIDRYSSLVVLLEEAAEKIYLNLDAHALIDSFFMVLRTCLGAETGSLYFLSEDGTQYILHAQFGYEPVRQFDQPEEVPADEALFDFVALSRRAVALYPGAPPDPLLERALPQSMVRAVMAGALPAQDKVAGIACIHSFKDDTPRDHARDTSLLAMLCNITSIAFANAKLYMKVQDMAVRDPLTKLFNRRHFFERLAPELSQCRTDNHTACLLLCDIDHFKAVNDKYGHQAGDAILIGFADACRKIIRDCDVLARYGGEEFIFLLPGLNAEEGYRAAQRIRRSIAAQVFSYGGQELRITASCGVAAFPEHGTDVASLTRMADLALYAAKAAGRNTVIAAGNQDLETVSEHDEVQHVLPAENEQ
ncbi:MAG TPA: sensor domain-containing diguanylate cyclase [Planctomycetota bacterium]|nr:sensor domain-containing diguanylate cyclase [Planctomycetota bacterium]